MPQWRSVQTLVDESGLAAVLELAGQPVSLAELVAGEVARLREAKAAQSSDRSESPERRPARSIVLRDLSGRLCVDMSNPVAIGWQAGLPDRVAELAAKAEAAMEASRQPPVSEIEQAELESAGETVSHG